MKRFYIFKDGTQCGSTATRESAVDLIHQYQEQETHYLLRPEFSFIEGKEEFVPYPPAADAAQEKEGIRAIAGGCVSRPPAFWCPKEVSFYSVLSH